MRHLKKYAEKKEKRSGNALITVILLITVFAIMLPAIVFYIRNEAKWTVKEKKRTSVFHLAEAGLDRGSWKINENSTNWTTIVGGGTLAGYNDDVIYTDVSGGSYKIKIAAVSTSSLSIVCNAKSADGTEFRALKAVFSKSSIVSPVQVPAYSAGGNFTVWWGPIYSTTGITVSGASDRLYPRKMARGPVNPRALVNGVPNVTNIDSDPNPEWWSFNSYPVPDPPVLDLPFYKAAAQTGSTYYTAFKAFPNSTSSTPATYYCELGGSISAVNTFMQGVIISMGNFTIDKKGSGAYSVTPSSNAWKEYVRACPNDQGVAGDSTEQDEYPGDGGYHTSKSFTFGTMTGGAPNKNPAFRGLVYVAGGGSFSGGANALMHGSVVVTGGGAFGGGGADLFYDDTIVIRTTSGSAGARISWEEITPTPF